MVQSITILHGLFESHFTIFIYKILLLFLFTLSLYLFWMHSLCLSFFWLLPDVSSVDKT